MWWWCVHFPVFTELMESILSTVYYDIDKNISLLDYISRFVAVFGILCSMSVEDAIMN